MKFLAHVVQAGGCDYTIGCGVHVSVLEADTPEEAQGKVEHDWFGICRGEDAGHENCHNRDTDVLRGVDRITIYPLLDDGVVLDVGKLRMQNGVEKAKLKAAEQRKKDEQQFEALRKKLGK